MTPEKQKKSKRLCTWAVSLAVLAACSLLTWWCVSSGGRVKVRRLNLTGDDGLTYSALLYVPDNATNETPAPAVITTHGGSANARNQESWAVEFSRRGYVCLSVDSFGGGDSEFESALGWNAPTDLYYQYLLALPFVDADNIASSGFSLGNNPGYELGVKYNAKCILNISGAGGTALGGYNGNLLMTYGDCENAHKPSDLADFVIPALNVEGLTAENIEQGKLYGSFEEGNARMWTMIPGQIHEGATANPTTIATFLDFLQQAIPAPQPIAGENQVWLWKDLAGLLTMIAFVTFIVCTAVLLLKTPFFASVVQPMPKNVGLRGVGLGISVAGSLVFPLIMCLTNSLGLYTLMNGSGLFKLRAPTIGTSFILGMTLLGLVMFVFFHATDGKKNGGDLRNYGLTADPSVCSTASLIGKAFLLALAAVAIGFTYLAIQQAVLGTDAYCLYFGYKAIPLRKLSYYLPYLPIYLAGFVLSSLGMNVERRLPESGNAARDTAFAMVLNAVLCAATITLVVIVDIVVQKHTALGENSLPFLALDVTRMWGMPFNMAFAGAASTYLHRKTGSIWLGAFVAGLVICLASCLYGQVRI